MIARGFRPVAVSTTPELADGALRTRTPARRPTDAPLTDPKMNTAAGIANHGRAHHDGATGQSHATPSSG
jgi:hypothetical protein